MGKTTKFIRYRVRSIGEIGSWFAPEGYPKYSSPAKYNMRQALAHAKIIQNNSYWSKREFEIVRVEKIEIEEVVAFLPAKNNY